MNRRLVCAVFIVALLVSTALLFATDDNQAKKKQPGTKVATTDKANVMMRFTKIDVQEATVECFGSAVIRASLVKPDGQPLSGKPVTVKIGTNPPANLQTSRGGAVAMEYKLPDDLLPGAYPIEVRFAGDESAPAGFGKGTLDVRKAETYIHFHPKNQHPKLPVKGEYVSVYGYLRRKLDDRSLPSGAELVVEISGKRLTVKANEGKEGEAGAFSCGGVVPDGVTEIAVKAEYGGSPQCLPAAGTYTFKAQNHPPKKAHLKWDFGDLTGVVGQEVTLKARVVEDSGSFGEPIDWSTTLAKGVPGVVHFYSQAPGSNWSHDTVPGSFSPCSANTDFQGWASCKVTLTAVGVAIVEAYFDSEEERWDVHADSNGMGKLEIYVRILSGPASK